eukprot:TRINITY_DN34982_c0_g1_i1.p1 TRINITY_DN34982_c0_g1~~TRINITY_DN34982_c0_g1_i1.p1  ORF type:complete len:113 (+),score=13.08 TRINITY_DN34982_c0_g1_i1:288-626(+)
MEEQSMLEYFVACFRGLDERGGILVIDAYGGRDAHRNSVENISQHSIKLKDGTTTADFKYVYEQAEYNPETLTQLIRVHFDFSDGTIIRNAFTYRWRIWNCLLYTSPSPRDS